MKMNGMIWSPQVWCNSCNTVGSCKHVDERCVETEYGNHVGSTESDSGADFRATDENPSYSSL